MIIITFFNRQEKKVSQIDENGQIQWNYHAKRTKNVSYIKFQFLLTILQASSYLCTDRYLNLQNSYCCPRNDIQ